MDEYAKQEMDFSCNRSENEHTHRERGCDMAKRKYGVLAWNKYVS